MNRSLSRAIKFRDLVLRDLTVDSSMLIWNNDASYARDIEGRIKSAFAFYIDPEGVSFLEDATRKLTEEEFFWAVSSMQLPFESVWVELDATTLDGKHAGRVGAMIDSNSDGLRVFSAQLFKLPEMTSPTILYSGSEVAFFRNGSVELSDTPAARFQDLMTEREKGRLRRGMSAEHAVQDDTVLEREADALSRAIRSVAMLMAISSLHNRAEVLDIGHSEALSRRGVRQYESRGEAAPKYSLSVISLGKLGRLEAGSHRAQLSDDSSSKRAAHWVRGHLFLARNGKIIWRKAHVRGEGVPIKKPRHLTR